MVLLESELAGICDEVDDSAELLHLNHVSGAPLEVSHDLAEPLLLLVLEESLLPLQGFDFVTSGLDNYVHFFETGEGIFEGLDIQFRVVLGLYLHFLIRLSEVVSQADDVTVHYFIRLEQVFVNSGDLVNKLVIKVVGSDLPQTSQQKGVQALE